VRKYFSTAIRQDRQDVLNTDDVDLVEWNQESTQKGCPEKNTFLFQKANELIKKITIKPFFAALMPSI
jgi:hypothetical protein